MYSIRRIATSLTRPVTTIGPTVLASFTTTSLQLEKLPPRPKIHEKDIIENFLKGSGPGGQKINKTSSAVQLQHIPTGIVVKSQISRSREFNRAAARKLLVERIETMQRHEKGLPSRLELKQESLAKKKARADRKKQKKYRALAAAADPPSTSEMPESEERHAHEVEGVTRRTEGG